VVAPDQQPRPIFDGRSLILGIPTTRRSRFNASTLTSTTTAPTTTINVGCSPKPTDAMAIAVGGIRYIVIVARLKST
jgi:hypothetical protein